MKAYILPFIVGALSHIFFDIVFANDLIIFFWTAFIVFLTFGAVYLYRARESKKGVFFQITLVLFALLIIGAAFPHVLMTMSNVFVFLIDLRLSLAVAASILFIVLLLSSVLSAVKMHEKEKALYDDLLSRHGNKEMSMD